MPATTRPRWAIIVPAPMKATPAITASTSLNGSIRTRSSPSCCASASIMSPMPVSMAAAPATSMCVRKPAGRSFISRSSPMAPPSSIANAMRPTTGACASHPSNMA